jgi:hypothetical protein
MLAPKIDKTNAERSRRARQRQREGKVVFQIEVDEWAFTEALIAEGVLVETHAEACAELQRLVETWIESEHENAS